MEDNLIKRLITSIKCSVCGQHYRANSVTILGRREDLWFLSTECYSCRARSLVAVVIKEDGLSTAVTDLSTAEQRLFLDAAAPTTEELLDMHEFLKGFSGDFASLFGKAEDLDKEKE